MSDEHTYTPQNNMRSPGYSTCIQWLSDIWRNFNEDLIKQSFSHCGITPHERCHSALQEILSILVI
jgi:hypothetical protein